MRERIFDRFVRGEGTAPGTGLGLPIVRALVEAQGGRVWLEDAPGGGARFAFSLPAPA
jgi:two-component system sensor histidine kinase KdpD